MYAYIDESGNTGKNLFDKTQPSFITAALITKENFDTVYQADIKSIANSIGVSTLHANEIGPAKVESISKDLLCILRKSESRFVISLIDKDFIATTKLFDTLFDSYENKAVPWLSYNARPLRLMLVFKLASILTEETAIKYWDSLMESNYDKAYMKFVEAIKELKNHVEHIPDLRSKQIITDAINWAIQHPEAIYIHTNAKTARAGHLPNMAVFPNILRGIDIVSKELSIPIKVITHDRQNQFQRMLSEWHDLISNADPGEISWIGEEIFSLRCVENSRFLISSSTESVGIQTIDTVLWLFKRFLEGKHLGKDSTNLLGYVLENAHQYGQTFEIVGRWLSEFTEDLFSRPMKQKDMKVAQELLKEMERKRQLNMSEAQEDND